MTEIDPQRQDTDLFAPYAMRWHGKNYAQFAKLPKLSRTARAFMIRTGRGVESQGVTAAVPISVGGTSYAADADLASLSRPVLNRVLRARKAH